MIIRHKRAMDVCFEVVHRYTPWNKYKGRWINMGYKKSWYLEAQNRTIKIEDLTEWEKCLDPYTECLRQAQWRSL